MGYQPNSVNEWLPGIDRLLTELVRATGFKHLDPFGDRHGSIETTLHRFDKGLDRYISVSITESESGPEVRVTGGVQRRRSQTAAQPILFRRFDIGAMTLSDAPHAHSEDELRHMLQAAVRTADDIGEADLTDQSLSYSDSEYGSAETRLSQSAARTLSALLNRVLTKSHKLLTGMNMAPPSLHLVTEGRSRIGLETPPGAASGLGAIVLRNDMLVGFLTVLDEDESGEVYFFLSKWQGFRGPVYCWRIQSDEVSLPFFLASNERHRYYLYLTEKEIPLPVSTHVDPDINEAGRVAERRAIIDRFLTTLESEQQAYWAGTLDV